LGDSHTSCNQIPSVKIHEHSRQLQYQKIKKNYSPKHSLIIRKTNIIAIRISWLGHLERMEEDRRAKKIFTRELEGTRRRGRPRKRWKEEVERDLQVLGVRRWKELVADRKKWKDIV